jgi:hypothetical protein
VERDARVQFPANGGVRETRMHVETRLTYSSHKLHHLQFKELVVEVEIRYLKIHAIHRYNAIIVPRGISYAQAMLRKSGDML